MPENETTAFTKPTRTPWNKGKLIGARPPLRPKHVWCIRTRLTVGGRTRLLRTRSMRGSTAVAADSFRLSDAC